MIDCAELADRMPDVRHGRAAWTEAEAAHVATCPVCGPEWRLVETGAALHSDVSVSPERVTATVLDRLRSEPRIVASRIPWRGVALAITGIAAALALVYVIPRRPAAAPATTDTVAATPTLIPELNDLSDSELESVLQTLQASVDDGATGGLPRLGDLDETQLEQLLRAEEG